MRLWQDIGSWQNVQIQTHCIYRGDTAEAAQGRVVEDKPTNKQTLQIPNAKTVKKNIVVVKKSKSTYGGEATDLDAL